MFLSELKVINVFILYDNPKQTDYSIPSTPANIGLHWLYERNNPTAIINHSVI